MKEYLRKIFETRREKLELLVTDTSEALYTGVTFYTALCYYLPCSSNLTFHFVLGKGKMDKL